MRDPEELAKVSAIPNVHVYCSKVCQRAAEVATELILEAAESEYAVAHKKRETTSKHYAAGT